MLLSLLLPASGRPFDEGKAGPPGADLTHALDELVLHGLPALAPALTIVGNHPGLLGTAGAHLLRLRLLKVAMEPLDRTGDWQPVATLLRAVDEHSAPLMQDILLPGPREGAAFDPTVLPDATLVVLAGLIDAGGRPGQALALLDTLESQRHTPRYMAMSWQARCHILGVTAAIDPLWPDGGIDGADPRSLARRHAADLRMHDALAGFATALEGTPPYTHGLGGDLAVMAAWLHAHGQGGLLEQLDHALARQPAVARDAFDLLLRAPASPAWEPMREDWLSNARHHFRRFMPQGRISTPHDDLMHCCPAA